MKRTALLATAFFFIASTSHAGWFWKPSVAAQGKINKIIAEHGEELKSKIPEKSVSSEKLRMTAWSALKAEKYNAAIYFADKCISEYSNQALQLQSGLIAFPSKKELNDYRALNDVGACLFIKAWALKSIGQKERSKEILQMLIDKYQYAQCWSEEETVFWKPAEKAELLLINMNG